MKKLQEDQELIIEHHEKITLQKLKVKKEKFKEKIKQ